MENSSFSFMLLHACAYFGVGGCLLLILAVALPAAVYQGRSGERYSPFNHFLSELGEVGISRAARIFNLGLFAAGCFFLPLTIGLGLTIGNLWSILGMLAGIGTAIACMLIGVFPMDQMERHIKAALSFFYAGLATIILFTLAIWLQPSQQSIIPKTINSLGVFSIISFSLFLLLGARPPAGTEITDLLHPSISEQRPRFWVIPIFEWMVFLTTIAWFLGVSLSLLKP